MKKRWITAIVFTSLGVAFALTGMIGMKFDFHQMDRKDPLLEDTLTFSKTDFLEDNLSLSLTSYYGDVEILSTDEESITVHYSYYKQEEFHYTITDDNTLSLVQGKVLSLPSDWYNPVSLMQRKNQIVISLPLSWTFSSFTLNLQNGNSSFENLKGENLNLKCSNMKGTFINGNFSSASVSLSSSNLIFESFFSYQFSFHANYSTFKATFAFLKEQTHIQIEKDLFSQSKITSTTLENAIYQIEGHLKFSTLIASFENEG